MCDQHTKKERKSLPTHVSIPGKLNQMTKFNYIKKYYTSQNLIIYFYTRLVTVKYLRA